MKVPRMGAELLHADGQTDMMKLTVSFGNFANALKNERMVSKTKKEAVYSEGAHHPLSYRFQCIFLGLPHLLVKRCYG
jgi:hypothetical protein